MALTWKSFTTGVTETRFLQPIWNFDFRVQYVPVMFDGGMLADSTNRIFGAVVDAMRKIKDCPLSELSLQKSDAKDHDGEDGESAYFQVVNSVPVYDFVLRLGPKTFQIQKIRSSLQDLIATLPILESTCATLFPSDNIKNATATAGNTKDKALTHLLAEDRIHRVAFTFDHRLRVMNRITKPGTDVTNVELIAKMARTSIPAGVPGITHNDAPLVCLQPFTPYRSDVTLSAEKTIAKRKRNIWIVMKAPYNILQKDADLKFGCRTGEGRSEVKMEDISDWNTPFTAFYRDIILNQFMPALFHDINIEPRIA